MGAEVMYLEKNKFDPTYYKIISTTHISYTTLNNAITSTKYPSFAKLVRDACIPINDNNYNQVSIFDIRHAIELCDDHDSINGDHVRTNSELYKIYWFLFVDEIAHSFDGHVHIVS